MPAPPSPGETRRSSATAPEAGAWALAGLALLLSASYLAAELYFLDGRFGFPLDDAWIHLAFGRALAAGEGLSINPGEPVAGSTSPLWTAAYACFVLLPGSAVAWAKGIGALLHAAGVAATHALARDLGLSRALAALAASLVALTSWLLWGSVSGMEIPLFTLLTLLGVRRHLKERLDPARAPLALPLFGLATLARPEGLLLVALALADRLLRFRRLPAGEDPAERALAWRPPSRAEVVRSAAGLGLAAVVVAPVALYYAAIGDGPLPTTLAVKTGHADGFSVLPDLRRLHAALGVFLRTHPLMVLTAPAGAVALVRRLGRRDDRGLLPALWLLGLPVAYACLGSDTSGPVLGNFGRYVFPLFPFLVVLGVLGLEPIAAALAPGRSPARRTVAAVAAALVLAPVTVDSVRGAGRYLQNLSNVEDGDLAMVRWLAPRLPPEAVLATVDLGAAAAFLPNPIVDLAGIASPKVSDFVRRARAEGRGWRHGVLDFVRAEKPDYLLVFPTWLPAVERPGSPFRRLHAVRVPDNITLGGDVLGLYETPWTRYPLRAVPTSVADPAANGERP